MSEYNGWIPRLDSQKNLTALADVMADGIRYRWGQRDINMGILQLAATELHRRRNLAIDAGRAAILIPANAAELVAPF